MQYTDTLMIQIPSEFNDYDEVTAYTEWSLKCRVLDDRRGMAASDRRKRLQYDILVAAPVREFATYKNTIVGPGVKVIFEGEAFEVRVVKRINTAGGRPRMWEVAMLQVDL